MLSSRLFRSPLGHAIRLARHGLASTTDETKAIADQVENAKNAFQLFKLEERLNIDVRELRNEMHRLQRFYHPDKNMNLDWDGKPKKAFLSTLINESYQTLVDPYKRAKHLLEVKFNKNQVEVENALDGLELDQEFLDRMMDVREQIFRARGIALVGLNDELDAELRVVIEAVDKAFREQNYRSVLTSLGKLKFLSNCQSALKEKLGE